MAPSAKRSIASTVIIGFAALTAASPVAVPEPQSVAVTTIYSNINTNMPFLPSVVPTSAPGQWSPQATQSEWDWRVWSASQAAASVSSAATASHDSSWAASVPTGPAASSSVPYSNPFTIYTTMTNSQGVITGMPAVATSQPNQPAVATVCSGCASVMSQQSVWASSVSTMMSSTRPVTTSASVQNSTRSASTSATATPSFQQSTGAGAVFSVTYSGIAAVVLGVVAFLL